MALQGMERPQHTWIRHEDIGHILVVILGELLDESVIDLYLELLPAETCEALFQRGELTDLSLVIYFTRL